MLALGPVGRLVEPLSKDHDRAGFSCGIESLDRYLHRQAGQDARKRVAAPFVLVKRGSNAIIGYYTLSAMGIDVGELPLDISRRLPRYPLVPATLLDRLAVDQRYRGQGMGEWLLMDALDRGCRMSASIASMAVVVDAKDDRARAFYERYEFRRFVDQPHRLFLPMTVIGQLLSSR